MNKLYEKPKSLFQQQVDDIITDDPSKKLIEDLLELHLLKNSEKSSKEDEMLLVELYDLLGIEKFTQVIDLFSGRKIKFPDKDDLKDTISCVLCYYYKYIQKKNWEEIKQLLGPDVQSVKMGIKASQLQVFIKSIGK